MNFKKRINGSWTDTPNYIYNTLTDTITTLPADIYPTGTTATVGLKGNTLQSQTPTPTTPVIPVGTGEKTGNLFDENYPNIKVDKPTYRSIYVGDGTFTLSTTVAQHARAANLFFLAGNVGSGASTQNNGVWNGNPRTVTAVDGYVTIAYRYYENDEISDPRSNDAMLNTGLTALPYEPYGYKIPILSNSTTTPVYLGEVETTRRIGKLVLTGEENWYVEGSDIFYGDPITEAIQYPPICSHFIGVQALSDNNQVAISQPLRINIKTNSITHTTSDFKTYLAAQYAAGTPVIVWYVLAEPTTGIVNEPLRKIGDYADEVSGITIPTIAGANTIDVDTTLEPSEVSINYKGWHPVTDVHRFNGTSWD